jgi:hypothetical protein
MILKVSLFLNVLFGIIPLAFLKIDQVEEEHGKVIILKVLD